MKELDPNAMKLVDASTLPLGRQKSSKWEGMFERIGAGKAWVIPEGEMRFSAVRTAMYALQRQGKFKTLKARKIKEANGKYSMYIVNTAKPQK